MKKIVWFSSIQNGIRFLTRCASALAFVGLAFGLAGAGTTGQISIFATDLSAPSQRTPQETATFEASFETLYAETPREKTPSDVELIGRIETLDPPEEDFFSKKLDCNGVAIKAASVVDDRALVEAWRRLDRQLRNQPKLAARLAAGGSELQIIGKDQGNTDLPEFRHLKGLPYDGDLTMDERCRGVGGKNASCGEENLLRLKNDRYFGRDICSHEFAHTAHMFGTSKRVREKIRAAFFDATAKKGLWRGAYAGSNEFEYLAELTMWYFGTIGDCGGFETPPKPGPDWLREYDPNGFQLLDDFYSGRFEALEDE